jgi:hypothetical protein
MIIMFQGHDHETQTITNVFNYELATMFYVSSGPNPSHTSYAKDGPVEHDTKRNVFCDTRTFGSYIYPHGDSCMFNGK